MATCTSIVNHGDTRLQVHVEALDTHAALVAGIAATDVGYRPNPVNAGSAVELLARWNAGERPNASGYMTAGYVHLRESSTGYPIVETGWVDYHVTEEN